MVASKNTPSRAAVEHWVRQAVYARIGKPVPKAVHAPNPLVVNVSARHCHLTQEAVETLLVKGISLALEIPLPRWPICR